MALGILIEFFADIQKTGAKKENPKMFVSTGFYSVKKHKWLVA